MSFSRQLAFMSELTVLFFYGTGSDNFQDLIVCLIHFKNSTQNFSTMMSNKYRFAKDSARGFDACKSL